MTPDAEEWWQQFALTVDRMLSRVHLADPLSYAELFNVRRRLEPLGDMEPRPSARNEVTWTIARH